MMIMRLLTFKGIEILEYNHKTGNLTKSIESNSDYLKHINSLSLAGTNLDTKSLVRFLED